MNRVCPDCGVTVSEDESCAKHGCEREDCIPESEYFDRLRKEREAQRQAAEDADRAKAEARGEMYEPWEPRPIDWDGLPNIGPPDILDGSFDNAAGRSFDTRSERKDFYRANQLRRTSIGESRRNGMDGMDHKCLTQAMSYPGQTDRRSSSEKRKS